MIINKNITIELVGNDRVILWKADKILKEIMQKMSIEDCLYIDDSQNHIYRDKFTHKELCIVGQFLIQLVDSGKLTIK